MTTADYGTCDNFEHCDRSGHTVHADGTVTHIFPDADTMARQKMANARAQMYADLRAFPTLAVRLTDDELADLAEHMIERHWRP